MSPVGKDFVTLLMENLPKHESRVFFESLSQKSTSASGQAPMPDFSRIYQDGPKMLNVGLSKKILKSKRPSVIRMGRTTRDWLEGSWELDHRELLLAIQAFPSQTLRLCGNMCCRVCPELQDPYCRTLQNSQFSFKASEACIELMKSENISYQLVSNMMN